MMLPTVALLSFAVTLAYATKVIPEEINQAIAKDPCHGIKCPKQKLPPYMTCARWYKPEGECCPVCACEKPEGQSYEANSRFEMKKDGYCWQCMCSLNSEGSKVASCYQRYCLPANCPKFLRKLTSDGCCEECMARRPRTFPPRPNGGRFPPRPNRRELEDY